MQKKIRTLSFYTISLIIITAFILLPLCTTFAGDSEGIALEKDVFFGWPIASVEDLPDEVIFVLYESETSAQPLASQKFPRGKYTLDFELSKSDGINSGDIARFKVNFTNKLNLAGDTDSQVKPKEIWSEIVVNGNVVGNRSRVSDDTMVQLILSSDASIATYLTLVYEGDDNPLTTIYRDLPLSTVATDGSESSLSSYFSAVASDGARGLANNWLDSGADVYTYSKVGIGTATPDRSLIVKYSSNQGSLPLLPAMTVANTNTTAGEFSFASFEFSGGNGAVLGQFFADGSGHFLDGTPNVYFRATTDSPILLGTNQIIRMIITNTGNVGIGTTTPAYGLAVNGTIGCKELTVTSTGWADFVFKDNYKLPALDEVEDFIAKNKHLPGIPTEAEVKEKGVNVGNISSKLLQKIEELTLYVIDLKKENDLLKGEFAAIQARLDNVNR